MKKASMTVFMGMSLMLILSIFFSLLEVVHYRMLEKESYVVSELGIESMFADYNRLLWDKYGILGMDAAYCKEDLDLAKVQNRIKDYLSDNLSGKNHLVMEARECSVTDYDLITDYDGRLFIKLCAESIKYSLAEDAIKLILNNDNVPDYDAANTVDIDEILEKGQEALDGGTDYEESNEKKESVTEVEGGLSDNEIAQAGNPIDDIVKWKRKGLLELAIPNGKEISDKSFSSNERVSQRTLSKGTGNNNTNVSTTERFLFFYYLTDKFSCFSDEKDREGIDYELEYIIGAKEDDSANLKAVVKKLMVLRCASNMGAIAADPAKLAQAKSLAISLAGASVNPIVIEAVQAGIVAAWAYVESILDIRRLLDGGRVALLKPPEEWTSKLTTLAACLDNSVKAKDSNIGVSYKTYLSAMLLAVNEKGLSYRTLDLIENELKATEDYKDMKMDNVIVSAGLTYKYAANPVFGSLVTIGNVPDGFEFNCSNSLSYISK